MSDANRGPGNEEIPGRQPIFLLPASISILGGLMLAVHVASVFALNEEGRTLLNLWFGFVPYRIIAGAGGEAGAYWPLIWTPVTHAFLHAGWDHLIINLLWFAIFATPIARRYGGVSMTILFLASAAAGALLFAATTLPQVQILVGASGGVAGLTGAASRFIFQPIIFARDQETGPPRPLGRHLAGLAETFRNPRSRYFVIVWTVLNAAVPLLPMLTGTSVQIAWQAHLGGFFAGFLLVGLFDRRFN
jgi:membrane associated rhomboid family serine protease